MSQEQAWVTLATTDRYAEAAVVLAQSLRRAHTNRLLHVLFTSGVTEHHVRLLREAFDRADLVDVLDSNDVENLKLIGRPDLGVTFTKLHCWRLVQYTKAVFLDADTFVVQNADELFDHEELSAAADVGWPDFFNSGVFVYRPSQETYRKLLDMATSEGSFDGGDQGLLNKFFADWWSKPAAFRLSFVYNTVAGAIYTYAAAHKYLLDKVKIVHFLGAVKPWHTQEGGATLGTYLGLWRSVHEEHVARRLRPESHLAPEAPPAPQAFGVISETGPSEEERRRAWEIGQPDYMGRDAFENIQRALDKALE